MTDRAFAKSLRAALRKALADRYRDWPVFPRRKLAPPPAPDPRREAFLSALHRHAVRESMAMIDREIEAATIVVARQGAESMLQLARRAVERETGKPAPERE